MRNYRFAILQYNPEEEFELRKRIQQLSKELIAGGWVVLSISLHKLLSDRIREQGDEWLSRVTQCGSVSFARLTRSGV